MEGIVQNTFQPPEVIQSVHEWLKDLFDIREIDCHFDNLPLTSTCVSHSPIPSVPLVKSYKSGGDICKYDFSVYMRVLKSDTAKRYDAIATLHSVADAFKAGERIEGIRHYTQPTITGNPSQIGSDDDGSDVYQATYQVTYRW